MMGDGLDPGPVAAIVLSDLFVQWKQEQAELWEPCPERACRIEVGQPLS